MRWLAKAADIAGTTDDAAKLRAAMPTALADTKNMFDMANRDDKGDIDFPTYVGLIKDGATTVFTGEK